MGHKIIPNRRQRSPNLAIGEHPYAAQLLINPETSATANLGLGMHPRGIETKEALAKPLGPLPKLVAVTTRPEPKAEIPGGLSALRPLCSRTISERDCHIVQHAGGLDRRIVRDVKLEHNVPPWE